MIEKYEWLNIELPQYEEFKKIVIDRTPLIDVRAPVEFTKGSFPNAVNLPLMNDEQRQLVGTKYNQSGKDEAIAFASELVTPEIKGDRLDKWHDFLRANPNAMLFCFRGGMRSKISQYWIYNEFGLEIPRLKGGYKAFRNYMLQSMRPENIHSKPVVISGYTGSGKTLLIEKVKNAINLEKLANHRGSTFGKFPTLQPSQIDFENALAYDIINLEHAGFKHMILEDESRHIGLSFIDDDLFDFFKNGEWILLECPIQDRVKIIANDYIYNTQSKYKSIYGKLGLQNWFADVNVALDKIRKKLGFSNHQMLKELLQSHYDKQLKQFAEELPESSKSAQLNKIYYDFIILLLIKYYDKMYEYQLTQKQKKPIFVGNHKEVSEFIEYNLSKSYD